ncbi:MAG: hypothetical protein HXX11_01950 [Desulfuromonadales bacterium]|nr:hypothetical protein [Desulfuromonadales bacterium]
MLVAICVSITISLDDFGLFRDVSKRELRIYTSERLAKYLFSFHYIPSKFQGVLLGPSLSDIIDTRGITATPIYNLSITGGNATELRRLFENVVRKNGKLQALVICVDPFITRKTGMEEIEMDSRLVWNSLGSTSSFNFYKKKRRVLQGKVSPDMSINTEWGRYHLIIPRPVTAYKLIASYAGILNKTSSDPYHIDPTALADLKAIVSLARQKNVTILAYYHPYPDLVFSALQKKFDDYKTRMSEIFGPDDPIWDFNDIRYRIFSSDYSNYLDQVHLSDKGAAYITKEINRLLTKKLCGATR